MIIVVFIYGLLEGHLFFKMVGRDWVNIEEMICTVNRYLRQEAESTEKARMKGKAIARGGRREEKDKQ